MRNYEIFTIGYEGRGVEEFISQLKHFHITRLIDVREIPLSRKKGFSKSALKERLEAEKIEYLHFKSLGSPSSIRNKLKQTETTITFLMRSQSIYLSIWKQ